MGSVTLLSASQVGTFQQCSLKWAFRYVHRAPEETRAAALVVGSAVDVAVKAGIHAIRSGDVSLERLDSEALFDAAWRSEVVKIDGPPIDWGSNKDEAHHREIALGVTRAFLDAPDLGERIDRIEALDVRFELPVIDPTTGLEVPDLTVMGILDAVERTPAGVRPLDFKTASSKAGYDESSLATHLQGSLYVDALQRLHPEDASDEMAFWIGMKLKQPVTEDRVVTISPSARRRALLTVLHAHRAMELGVALPQPSFLCAGCPYRLRCQTWQEEVEAPAPLDAFAVGV